MRRIALAALIAYLAAALTGAAFAETAAPAGGTLAEDVKALRSYAPPTNPGQTNFNATDRAAIANQIYAYAFAYDNGDADAWSSGNVRRHLMPNILFLDQTAETAHVSVVGLLTNAKDGKTFGDVTSLNYEGWLVKGPKGWKIQRWHDFPDSVVPQ